MSHTILAGDIKQSIILTDYQVIMWRPAGFWILDIHVLTDVQTG